MFTSLLFFLLFEPIQPSYGTFLELMPASVIMSELQPLHMKKSVTRKPPMRRGDSIGPVIQAESVYAVDLQSGTPFLVKNIFTRRQIASIAKLMTAMVVLDNHALNEKARVSKNAASQAGAEIGLVSGEEITVKNLLIGMLVNSGNDAAVALAEFDAGSEDTFVSKLNKKAVELGLKDTHFSNAKGFDEDGNYSTAYDTFLFSIAALEYPFIRETVRMQSGEISSFDGKTTHALESTNELLGNPYFPIIGLKTGHTPAAGKSFVSLAKMSGNHEILTVLLSSPDRFKETEIVIDWITRNYEY